MLRHAALGGVDLATGQVGRIALAGVAGAGRADLNRAVGGALRQEVEAVIDILAERHEEDVGVVAGMRQARFLGAQDVRDRPGIEPVIDRVEAAVADRGVGRAVARIGQPDEGRVGLSGGRVVLVVAVSGDLARSKRTLGIVVVGEGQLAIDQPLEALEIARGDLEGAARRVRFLADHRRPAR